MDESPPAVELSPKEHDEAEKRVAVTAHVVHEAIRRQGEEELSRPVSALAWSGLAAGFTMSFSLIAEGLFRTYLPDAPWRTLLVSLGYPLGYLIVIIGRQQLFTENTLTAVIPLLTRPRWTTLGRTLRLWLVVLISNLAGVHFVAWTIGNSSTFSPEVQRAFAQIGAEAANVSFASAVLKGIFAGWLIAMVVWMIASSRNGQIAIIYILTYFIGLGHFTHVIAGSVDVLYLVFTGARSWTEWLSGYLLPTLLGNVLGGVSLVSLINHAQVVSGRENEDSK